MFNGIKKGNAKCADEYFVGDMLEEGVLSLYKYTYYDLKEVFKKIGKSIDNSTFSHWIEDLELRKKGLAIKKGKKRITWYLNEEGINMLFEYGKNRKCGYVKRLRVTEKNTYNCEIDAKLVQKLDIKRYDELQRFIHKLIQDYIVDSEKKAKEKQIELIKEEIERKQEEINKLLEVVNNESR